MVKPDIQEILICTFEEIKEALKIIPTKKEVSGDHLDDFYIIKSYKELIYKAKQISHTNYLRY